MSDAIFDVDDDANTPLTEEEKVGLFPSYITLRSELNEVEQINIAQGTAWSLSRRRDVLDEGFLRELHRRMYGEVWKWAGKTRKTDKNIGIDVYRIAPELHQLLGDVRYWVEHSTYPSDEIAVRFHHRSWRSTSFRTAMDATRVSPPIYSLCSSVGLAFPGVGPIW